MLLVLVLVWAALLVAVCAICAAGGQADEEREKLYDKIQSEKGSGTSNRDAADAFEEVG
jgi:hypothetical protein